MRFLDTNIFVRYLMRDDPAKALACDALFDRLRNGQETATTCEMVLGEVVYVLGSPALYARTASEIRALLAPVLQYPGLHLPNKQVYLRALDLYAQYPALRYEDSLVIAHMEQQGIAELYSYDRDFDRVPGVQRIEPT